MKLNLYLRIASAIFVVVALVHLVRILSGFQLEAFGEKYPLWLSWIELVTATFLAYQGFKLSRKN